MSESRFVILGGGMVAGYAARQLVELGLKPGELANLRNCYYLRSLDDSKAIRRSADAVKRAVVIGGGFIGMEVAAVLAQKGVEVTMVLSDDHILKRLFSPQMSRFFEAYFEVRGVHFIKSTTATGLRGDGAVSAVVLAGGQAIACEMVVAGIGVRPVTDLLANSGIDVADGVVVNEYLETSQPDIYAAGDVASYQDLLFEKRRRVEHWDNAVSQGQYCARALMGERTPFRHVPYFFSDVFDLSYEYWGDSAGADQIVHRGDLSSNSFSVWWLAQSRVVAAFTMNRLDEERGVVQEWIETKRSVSGTKLEDASRSIREALE